MEIVHARESFRGAVRPWVFLAGPTPRNRGVPSWRPEALKLFERRCFCGSVFVPEDRNGTFDESDAGLYREQIRWEWTGLDRADAILFWIPRDLEKLPGFTTNVEFGRWATLKPGQVVFGAPQEAPKVAYLRELAAHLKISQAETLSQTVDLVLALLPSIAGRMGAA